MTTTLITHEQIIAKARECLGTPWVHQGRDVGPRGGIDCIGLLIHPAQSLGLSFYDNVQYGRRPKREEESLLMQHLRRAAVEMTLDDLAPGRIVVFSTRRQRRPAHVGIVTDWDQSGNPPMGLVHTYLDVGQCVENPLDESYWMPLLHACFGWPGVDD